MKKLSILTSIIITAILLTACGASKEKIAEAQSKYKALLTTHNQVHEAYDSIADDSLREELNELAQKVEELNDFNLKDMSNDEIDILIETMNSIDEAYSEYLKTIGQIKYSEASAALERLQFSLKNLSDKSIEGLWLMEKGEKDLITNALEETGGLLSGEMITGLCIYRDKEATPWIMEIGYQADNGDFEKYEFTIDDTVLPQGGITLIINQDMESGELIIETEGQ